jgi:hypothetical protein
MVASVSAGGGGVTRPPITTKGDARRLVVRLSTRASVFRLAGFNRLGTEDKRRLADDLDDACALIQRLLGDVSAIPRTLPDIASAESTAEPDASEADLFGGAA